MRMRSGFRQEFFVLTLVLALAGWQRFAVAEEHEDADVFVVDGEILVVHIDYFDRGASQTVYHLRDRRTGTVYELRFERRAPPALRTGDKVTITGRGLGSKIWVQDIAPRLQEEGAEESQAEAPAMVETETGFARRAILMIVNMATVPGYYGEATAQTGATEMFTGSFSVNISIAWADSAGK